MLRLVAILAIPILEIALYIQLGRVIGLWPVMGLILLAIVAGVALLRGQAMEAAATLRRGTVPENELPDRLVGGILTFLAGVLLIVPGLLSDLAALLLLLPAVRRRAAARLRMRVRDGSLRMRQGPLRSAGGFGADRRPDPPRGDRVIDGEFEDVTPPVKPTHPPSGWTRH